MADNIAVTAGAGTTIAADDIGGALHQRVKATWGPDGTANDTDVASGKPMPVQLRAPDGTAGIGPGEATIGGVRGWGFDIVVAPTVTSGAYSANDVMGGLLTFANAARIIDEPVIVTGIEVAIKSAVLPVPTVVLFSAAPTAMADNDAYALSATDVLKVRKSVQIIALGGTLMDHGTPNTYSVDGLGIVMKPVSGTRDVIAYLIDTVGVTPTSTSDLQVRLVGVGV